MRSTLLVCSVLVFALAGCASDTGQAEAESESPKAAATKSSAPSELGTIKASGFGQDGEYVWVTAVVHNNSTYVGQTVTVNFNVLDKQGEILESESQVESFSRPKSDHAIGTQVTLEPGQKAAKVEATLDVEAAGAFSDQPFPEMPTSAVKVAQKYGAQEASFELTNPMSEAVKSPRIQLVCSDAGGSIVGGGMAFPDLVPAGGKIKVDTNVIVSGKPQECSAYVGAPSDWEGEASASPLMARRNRAEAPKRPSRCGWSSSERRTGRLNTRTLSARSVRWSPSASTSHVGPPNRHQRCPG